MRSLINCLHSPRLLPVLSKGTGVLGERFSSLQWNLSSRGRVSLERGFPHFSGTSLQGDACPWREVFLTPVEPLFKGMRVLGERFSSLQWNLSSRGRVSLERGFPHFSGTSLQGDACPWREVFLTPGEPLFKGTGVLGERFSSLQWNLSSRGRVSLERGFPHFSGTSLQGDGCLSSRGRVSLERGFPHSSGTSLQGDRCPWREVFLTPVEPLFKGTGVLGERFSSLLSSRGLVSLEIGFPHSSGTSLQGDGCPWKEVFLTPVESLFKGTRALGERFSSFQWSLSSRGRVPLERGCQLPPC